MSQKITYKDLYNQYLKTHSDPTFLGDVSSFPFLAEYVQSHTHIERLMNRRYSSMLFDYAEDDETVEDLYTLFKQLVRGILEVNKYKYTELAKTTEYDYNPINNYDMSESGTDTEGARSDSTSIGSQTQTLNKGAEQQTFNKGAEHSSASQTNQTTGFNVTPDMVPDNANSSLMDSNAYTDTTSNAAYTDTTSIGARSDGFSKGEQINKYTHERHGNIGVMSTQDLINQQRQVVDFSFISIVFDDIIDNIFMNTWEVC